jgi:pteridine reductase
LPAKKYFQSMYQTDTKISLVTGSGRRLGKHIALGLARGGYDVVLHACSSVDGMHAVAEQIRAMGRRAWTFEADLSEAGQAARLARDVLETTGRLDVLVNNAGIFPKAAYDEVSEVMWDEVMNTNLRSVFFLSQNCAGALRDAHGSIVNIASSGAYSPWADHIPYSVSKAGLVMLTKALAKVLAPDVRVNAVAPGLIHMPGDEPAPPELPVDRFPLKRYGNVDDVINAILFLTDTADYVTGHVLLLDGGRYGTESLYVP